MLSEALTALAAAGGTAIVQAAGTDAWTGVRHTAARLLSRGNPAHEQAALQRLDQTAAALTTGNEQATEIRRQAASWQTHFEALLGDLADTELDHAIAGLHTLAAASHPAPGTLAGAVFNGPAGVQTGPGSVQHNHFGKDA